ncbi:hypothetical protein EVG20_g11345, partial [Dentipellis fragilis]
TSAVHNAAAARRMLELEMEAVELVTSSLRTRYNALASVNRLSSEMLALVFHSLRQVDTPGHRLDREVNTPSQIIGWVQVTHVCRQWRNIALEHPSLWSYIAFTLGAQWKEVFFRRSKMAPIVIEYDLGYRQDTMGDFAGDVAHHLSHTRELSLTGTLAEFASILPPLRGPAPLLERLEFCNVTTDVDVMPSLPPDIFSGYAPRLRHIRLPSWHLHWPSVTFEALVYLSISQKRGHSISEGIDCTGELSQVLGVLARMPALEFLSLEHVLLPPARGATPHSVYGPMVTLSKLEHLHLTDDIRNCGLALRHINVPDTARHRIKCTGIDQGCGYLLPWLGVKVTMSQPIRVLSIREHHKGFEVSAWERWDPLDADEWLGPALFHLNLRTRAAGGLPLTEIRSIFRVLPLEHLEKLSVMCHRERSAQDWFAILGICKALRYVEITTSEALHLCELFTRRFPPEGRTQLPFPSLKILALSYIHFDHEPDLRASFLDSVRHGVPSGQFILIIKYCSFDKAMLEQLKRARVQIYWDGRIHKMPDTEPEADFMDSDSD